MPWPQGPALQRIYLDVPGGLFMARMGKSRGKASRGPQRLVMECSVSESETQALRPVG